MTQLQKIIELCSDGAFHCQVEFWNLFIRSPHKRRAELEKTGKYLFQSRPCEHGHKNVRDYLMIEIVGEVKDEKVSFCRPEVLAERRAKEKQRSLI